jgi:hypothetical protein
VTPPVRTIPPVQDLPEPESKSAEPKPEETKPAESKATDATPPTTDKE